MAPGLLEAARRGCGGDWMRLRIWRAHSSGTTCPWSHGAQAQHVQACLNLWSQVYAGCLSSTAADKLRDTVKQDERLIAVVLDVTKQEDVGHFQFITQSGLVCSELL